MLLFVQVDLTCLILNSTLSYILFLQEVRQNEDLYKTAFYAQNGTATLHLTEDALKDTKYYTGQFKCMAGNFLGRVQKLFIVNLEEDANNCTESTTDLSHPVPALEDDNSPIPNADVSEYTELLLSPNNSFPTTLSTSSNHKEVDSSSISSVMQQGYDISARSPISSSASVEHANPEAAMSPTQNRSYSDDANVTSENGSSTDSQR